MNENKKSFFSVAFNLILVEKGLPYDLYINSAASLGRERFVRIYPRGEGLTKLDIKEFKQKYHQLYVLEDQRSAYLKSLVEAESGGILSDGDVAKTNAIKDSAIHYLGGLFDTEKEFTTEVLNEAIEGCRESVESMVGVIKDYDIQSLQSMIGKLSFHDFYTYDHSINVSMYNISMYKAINAQAQEKDLVVAGLGGLLHDLGKIKIPTSIINNPSKLTDDQFEIIKQHPDFGKELIHECECEGHDVDFSVIEKVVHEHHENFNGTGYPLGTAGEDIHLLARITAISDFFDALTTKRSYHEALTTEEAIGVMAKSVGKKIDPALFDVFCQQVQEKHVEVEGERELPEDFDPCQPHNVLPFKQLVQRKVVKKVIKKKIVKKKVVKKKKAA